MPPASPNSTVGRPPALPARAQRSFAPPPSQVTVKNKPSLVSAPAMGAAKAELRPLPANTAQFGPAPVWLMPNQAFSVVPPPMSPHEPWFMNMSNLST